MKRKMNVWLTLLLMALAVWICRSTAYAITEAEVQAQVAAQGKEAVTGNILIWFLCAIAFLKVSQKLDSFLSSIGLNVGHTGGSMMAEALIALRGVNVAKGLAPTGRGHSSGAGSAGNSSAAFMSGGLAGVVGRGVASSAAKAATGTGSGGIGGAAYSASVAHGGSFANSVIGSVATGNNGTITGQNAQNALMSYMGYAALEPEAEDIPHFSNVEIGGGRITATETSQEYPDGIDFGMYYTGQYDAPTGDYTTVTATDGTSWYKQYAVNAVQRTPQQNADKSIAYEERLIKKLPDPPRRKGQK